MLPCGGALVASNATVAAQVMLGNGVSIWFQATVRGDVAPITVGAGTAILDGAMVHPQTGFPVAIGAHCFVSHGAIAHMIELGEGSLVGIGAVLMARSKIGKECWIAAGALVPEGKVIADRSVVVGVPGKIVRQVTDAEARSIREQAERAWYKACVWGST